MTEKLGPRVGQSRPARPRPVRARTRWRQLHRWATRHAQPLEQLDAALQAMTVSARPLPALAELGFLAAAGDDVIPPAAADVEAFLVAVRRAKELPPVPDVAARASFGRMLAHWEAGAELQLASIHPSDGDGSARAAEQIEQGCDEYVRFALAFVRTEPA